MCLEVPAANPQTFSHITRHHRHILQLETILMSIYYPAAFGSGAGKDPSGRDDWSRETWLPHPRSDISKGYGAFAGLPHWLTVCWFFVTTWFTKLPSFRNAKLAEHWAPKANSKDGGWKVKNEREKPPEGCPEKPVFPLIMFSHGLGGTRTTYSSVCGEFASYGFIVCAVEHRDGSGPRTFVNHPHEGLGCREEREATGHVDHFEKERQHSWDVQDFIFPKQNPQDTFPGNERGVDHDLRTAQIHLRLAELEEAYEVIIAITDGMGLSVAEKNLRNARGIGSSSRGLDGVEWDAWKGRVNTTQVTMVGHSFGAATTIELLRHADRFQWVSQGIIYDIWGLALEPPETEPRRRINAPLLGINSEAFMYWADNFNAARTVCQEAREHGALTWLMTVRGTVHISQSDFPILYPYIASLVLKQTMDPRRAIDVNISASLEYLAKVMPHPIFPFHRCLGSDNFLKVPTIDQLPSEHKPDEKWLAVRLKMPHEIRGRAIPKLRRRLKKYGGMTGDEKEIWMHISPTEEDFRIKRRGRTQDFLKDDATVRRLQEDKKIAVATTAAAAAEEPQEKGFAASATSVWPSSSRG